MITLYRDGKTCKAASNQIPLMTAAGWSLTAQQAEEDNSTAATYSAAAAELADVEGVDLADVVGTGAGGNITKTDVQNYIDDNA